MRFGPLAALPVLVLACGPTEQGSTVDTTVATQPTSNRIDSDRWPHVPVTVDSAFRPLGMRVIEMGSGGEAEIHVLADVSDTGEVRRFYWIQFEGRGPENPRPYDYSSLPYRDTIDGYPFFTGVRHGAYTESEIANERDTGTVGAILAEHGYDFPAPMMRVRTVTLDEDRRNELLVIYMEALSFSGATEAALADSAAWADAAARLRARAAEGLGLGDS